MRDHYTRRGTGDPSPPACVPPRTEDYRLGYCEEDCIATQVEVWKVGSQSAEFLRMTAASISGHLVTDWVPSLPAETGASFIGWPSFLLESVRVEGRDLLALRAEAGRSERQWKSFLSWMLGVAGARHILRDEGYRWIASLSAFYPDAVEEVDLTRWNGLFPRSALTAEGNPRNSSLVRPDYVALRSTSAMRSARSYEWAVAEAKGASFSLSNRPACPSEWSAQVRNVVLKLNGTKIRIPRHIVIATRVNPNATKVKTRRIQLRAWNKREEPERPELPAEAAVLISAAHLFGLFKGLRLPNNAAAIALAVSARRNGFTDKQIEHIQQASESAEQELLRRTQQENVQTGAGTAAQVVARYRARPCNGTDRRTAHGMGKVTAARSGFR
jgi:hypothetical protein